MAVTVVNTLYPPLLETFQPAFIYNTGALITFSLSPFNSIEEITCIHVSVVDQRNNSNVLKTEKAPTAQTQIGTNNTIDSYYGITNGLLIAEIPIFNKNSIAKQKKGFFQYDPIHDLYGIHISQEWLSENNYWNNNQYYQIQIRFDKNTDNAWRNDNSAFAKYMLDNREYFSEWSVVTLIKPILEPVLSIVQLDTETPTYTYPGSFHISGSMTFLQPNSNQNGLTYPETERLQSYRIIVEKQEQEVIDSDWIYARQNISNQTQTTIDYLLDLNNMEADDNLVINIYCRTNNGYIFNQQYTLILTSYDEILENISWNNNTLLEDNVIDINQEDGISIITFSADKKEGISFNKAIIYFRRACSKDNFQTWELIYSYNYTNTSGRIVVPSFQDYTIGSLYKYQYSAQICIIDTEEQWGQVHKSDRFYVTFYEMLLMRQNRQIAIRYNGQISSWKPTVNRQKIDTLGGKYPKFVESAAMNYKTYQISGLISAEEDFNRKFLSELEDINVQNYDIEFDTEYLIRNDTVADGENLYTEIDSQHDSYPHNHWYWEREFREQLVAWLNDGEPKLYRSMPEGNIAVMLTDINLTPDSQLGRLLYNFSATMYEVGDGYSLEELNNLDIINIPNKEAIYLTDFTLDDDEEEDILGTLVTSTWYLNISSNSNLGNWIGGTAITHNTSNLWADMSIKEQLDEYYGNTNDQVNENSIKLNNINIQFTTPPQYYSYKNGNFTLTNQETEWLGYVIQISTDTTDDNIQQIFINQKGYYHIPDSVNVKNIQVLNGQATILCECQYRLQPRSSTEINTRPIFQKTIIGQYTADSLPLNVDIIPLIYQNHEHIERQSDKYGFKFSLQSCKGILLDVTPYTYIQYQEKDQNDILKLTIGQTGVFNSFNDWPLENLYILGRRMILINPNDTLGDGSENSEIITPYPYTLEEWECYQDIQGNTTNPKINGIYIKDGIEQIYYIDENWYPINTELSTTTIKIAQVPIYGMINYYGDLVKENIYV